MKTKIISKLPSINALQTRIYIISSRIDACEGDIPEEFWCDSCKGLMKKIENLNQKIEDAELNALQPKAYSEMNKAESRVDQGRVDYYKEHSQPTPTYKYKCAQCGRVFVNDDHDHLCPPLGVILTTDKKLRCGYCAGIVEEIKPKTQ